MSNDIDDLKSQWQQARRHMKDHDQSANQLVMMAKRKKRSTIYAHYANIAILTITLIAIIYFFYDRLSFQAVLSQIGLMLMIGGLALRIAIELFSVLKSLKIDLSDHAFKNTDNTLKFYRFRKQIHGPVTIAIVGMYVFGFLMLTPEFYLYLALPWLILIDSSFILGAVILIWQIRKGIRKEMQNLLEITRLKSVMMQEP